MSGLTWSVIICYPVSGGFWPVHFVVRYPSTFGSDREQQLRWLLRIGCLRTRFFTIMKVIVSNKRHHLNRERLRVAFLTLTQVTQLERPVQGGWICIQTAFTIFRRSEFTAPTYHRLIHAFPYLCLALVVKRHDVVKVLNPLNICWSKLNDMLNTLCWENYSKWVQNEAWVGQIPNLYYWRLLVRFPLVRSSCWSKPPTNRLVFQDVYIVACYN